MFICEPCLMRLHWLSNYKSGPDEYTLYKHITIALILRFENEVFGVLAEIARSKIIL